MRYWDASGVVSLCARDGHYERASPLLTEDQEIVTWWATPVECVSAFARLRRMGEMSGGKELSATERLHALSEGWTEIQPGDTLRRLAEQMVFRHGLKAMDALQLAAAVDWGGGSGRGLEFVSFDEQLSRAAALEGFRARPST